LAKPFAQYFLRTGRDQHAGVVTNRLVGQIDIGAVQVEKAFCRREIKPPFIPIAGSISR